VRSLQQTRIIPDKVGIFDFRGSLRRTVRSAEGALAARPKGVLPHGGRRRTETEKLESRRQKVERGGREELGQRKQGEERFLSAQADRFAGAKREEKVGLLRSK
jgi:hypothetical protein